MVLKGHNGWTGTGARSRAEWVHWQRCALSGNRMSGFGRRRRAYSLLAWLK